MTKEEKILDLLEGARFADWYSDDGDFGAYIRGDYEELDEKYKSREDILADIRRLFKGILE